MSDGNDSDVPDLEVNLNIQPYQFEPQRRVRPTAAENNPGTDGESDTDSHDEEERAAARRRDTRRDNDAWCDCGRCIPMSTEDECLCCQEISRITEMMEERDVICITEDNGFIANCLNKDVLIVSVLDFAEHHGPIGDNEPVHELYRHVAYRRFARWVWMRLGRRNRKILPACVVSAIRQAFPSQEYTGFKYVMP